MAKKRFNYTESLIDGLIDKEVGEAINIASHNGFKLKVISDESEINLCDSFKIDVIFVLVENKKIIKAII